MTHIVDPEVIAKEADDEAYADWLEAGIAAGWVSSDGCMTHNAIPLRDWEEALMDDGSDPCIIVLRVWKDGYEHYRP